MAQSHPILRYFIRGAIIIATAFTLSACGTTQSTAKTDIRAAQGKSGFLLQASQNEFEELVKNADVKSKLLNQYASWKGVRYRLGGSSKKGIDCSAFVQVTFREQFGMDLPRSTSGQTTEGKQISRSKLRPGDLVMFRAGSTGKHVGIYLGNDKFVHASTQKGVMISSLNENYWNNRFKQARRVLHSGRAG
ncbi:MAG: bifunctional murein DD-endopeptidase/murein LD-carboxypeptidase [Enterobacteriaceae bacterium]